ncbi:hypothetical protein FVER53590_09672 [Fusarium verticillioides]|nr:hypothetical protein FVER53590_09672 [Fusarium verticillioides]
MPTRCQATATQKTGSDILHKCQATQERLDAKDITQMIKIGYPVASFSCEAGERTSSQYEISSDQPSFQNMLCVEQLSTTENDGPKSPTISGPHLLKALAWTEPQKRTWKGKTISSMYVQQINSYMQGQLQHTSRYLTMEENESHPSLGSDYDPSQIIDSVENLHLLLLAPQISMILIQQFDSRIPKPRRGISLTLEKINPFILQRYEEPDPPQYMSNLNAVKKSGNGNKLRYLIQEKLAEVDGIS